MAGIVQSSSRIQSPPIPSISGSATAVVPNGRARVASGACRIPRQRGQTTPAGLAVSPLAAVPSTAVELLTFGASMSIDSDAGNGSTPVSAAVKAASTTGAVPASRIADMLGSAALQGWEMPTISVAAAGLPVLSGALEAGAGVEPGCVAL